MCFLHLLREERTVKLLTFKKDNKEVLGVKTEAGVIDLELALQEHLESGIETDIMELITAGELALAKLQQYIEQLPIDTDKSYVVDEDSLTFAPAVTRPNKIICVGLNYRKHADETKSPYPDYPVLFSKYSNALSGHNEEVVVPHVTKRVDHEVELGIVIGKQAKYISEEDALDYVFGYCTTNDLSARDLQKRVSQFLTGKSLDGFAPVGPYVVTKDEIENPNNLRITTKVNGEIRQDSNTKDMVFNCEELVSYISQYMTLEPGDLIMTGTPEGVILGKPIEERVYLQPGDIVTVEVENLGALTTKLVGENK